MNLLALRGGRVQLILAILGIFGGTVGMVVQDNLRTTFVNGRKLFIPAGQTAPMQFSQMTPQQKQQQGLIVRPQQQQQQQQQQQRQFAPSNGNGNGRVVNHSMKRKYSKKWRQLNSAGPASQFDAAAAAATTQKPRPMSRFGPRRPTPAHADIGYYYAADDTARGAKATKSPPLARQREQQQDGTGNAGGEGAEGPQFVALVKSSPPGQAKSSSSRESDVRPVENTPAPPEKSRETATQSTEDLAEPPAPAPPALPAEPLLPLPLTSSRPDPKEESDEAKELKRKKKKKGKNHNSNNKANNNDNNGKKMGASNSTDSSMGSTGAGGGEPFTEYVNPDRLPADGTTLTGPDESTINRYSPPMTPTEQSISMMLRCQDMTTRALIPSATTCRNTRSDKVCAYLFADVDRKTGRRDVKCNLQGMEDIAESCRRTCGICCEDINYSCEDDSNGIIDCAKQLDKCHTPKWFGVLSRFCAGSCGLCALAKCRDYDNTCRVRKALCLEEATIDYMRENCARTCGFCFVADLVDREDDETANIAGMLSSLAAASGAGGPAAGLPGAAHGGSRHGKPHVPAQRLIERPPKMGGGSVTIPATTPAPPECVDREPNCASSEELCGSPVYAEFMIKFCTRTCLKCGGGGAPAAAAAAALADTLRRFKSPLPQMEPALEAPSLAEPATPPIPSVQYSEPVHYDTGEPTTAGRIPYGVLDLLTLGEEEPPAAFEDPLAASQGLGQAGAEWWPEPATPRPPSDARRCRDRHHKCATWAASGFCTSPRFSPADRLRLCPKSCELCALL